MISLGIVKRNILETKHTSKKYSGGYPAYFKLFKKYLKMRKTSFVKNNFNFYQRFKSDISIFLQCMFKPFLYIFHQEKYLHFSVITESNSRGYIETNLKVHVVNIQTFIFRIIPIWYSSRNRMTQSEIKEYTEK